MDNKTNPIGKVINQYLMLIAMPLGGYFIIEYLIRNYSASSIFLGFLSLPLMVGTVIFLFIIVKRLRDRILGGKIAGFMAWTFGTQVMMFAALIEAAFIYVFNEFLVPTNLVTIRNQMIDQYENVMAQVESLPNQSGLIASMSNMMQQSIDVLKESPVPSAIDSAMTMLSNDIFIGMILMAIIAPIVRRK